MILYDPRFAMNFKDYGILIPVLGTRATRVMDRLSALPDLAGKNWLQNTISESIDRVDLERVHDTGFVTALYDQVPGPDGHSGLERELLKAYELIDTEGRPRRYEPTQATRPLSRLFTTILGQVAGTYQAARLAQDNGFCFYLGGGMHHARRDGGLGFCLINDIMVAAERLRAEGRARLIWIIDVDAHKGDGTAEIVAAARKKPARTSPPGSIDSSVPDSRSIPGQGTLTLSMHMADGWPLDVETITAAKAAGRGPDQAPFAASDVELPIKSGDEATYLSRLADGLTQLETLSAPMLPDLAIVVDGADPYEHDGLLSTSSLRLDLETCVQRDLSIFGFLKKRGIPSAWLMAGGYGVQAWEPPAAFLASVMPVSCSGLPPSSIGNPYND